MKAVTALLCSRTIEDAASKTGLTKRTILRYLKEPAFQDELKRQEKQVLDLCSSRLAGMAGKALDALEDVIDTPDQPGAGNKRLAAAQVLELVLKYRDLLNFEDRIGALERKVNSETK